MTLWTLMIQRENDCCDNFSRYGGHDCYESLDLPASSSWKIGSQSWQERQCSPPAIMSSKMIPNSGPEDIWSRLREMSDIYISFHVLSWSVFKSLETVNFVFAQNQNSLKYDITTTSNVITKLSVGKDFKLHTLVYQKQCIRYPERHKSQNEEIKKAD